MKTRIILHTLTAAALLVPTAALAAPPKASSTPTATTAAPRKASMTKHRPAKKAPLKGQTRSSMKPSPAK